MVVRPPQFARPLAVLCAVAVLALIVVSLVRVTRESAAAPLSPSPTTASKGLTAGASQDPSGHASSSGSAAPGSASAAAPSTSQTLAVCEEAARLTEAGYPQRAVALIDRMGSPAVTGGGPSASTANDQSLACTEQRSVALARRGAAERLALLAPTTGDTPDSQYEHPVPSPSCATPSATTLVAAWDCDRENDQVLTRIDAASSSMSPAEVIGKKWASWLKTNAKPLSAVLLAFVIWVAAAVVLLQFLPNLTKNRFISTASEKGWFRRLLGRLGAGLVLLGAFVGTFGVTGEQIVTLQFLLITGVAMAVVALGFFAHPAGVLAGPAAATSGALLATAFGIWLGSEMEVPAAQLVVPAIVVTILGVLAGDATRRSSQRMRVTVDQKDTEKSAADLRGMICDLGASGARGIELPRGPDTDILKDIDLETLASGSWAKIVSSVLSIFKPYAPWTLRVETVSDSKLTFSLDRNTAVQDAGLFDTAPLAARTGTGTTAIAKGGAEHAVEDVALDPMAAPAAFATVRVARAHGRAKDLSGATAWRSIALQYLAAIRPDPYDDVSKALLAWAVNQDPANRVARLSFLLASYRHSVKGNELRSLGDALAKLIVEIEGHGESALLLRARYARVAAMVNQAFATDSVPVPGVATEYVKLWRLCDALSIKPSDPAGVLAASSLLAVKQMVTSVNKIEAVSGGPNPDDGWPESPKAAYSRACGFMPLSATQDPTEVVSLISIASALPSLAKWQKTDPQLTTLRPTPAYREKFGEPSEHDFLTLEPYATYRQTLESLDLRDAHALAGLNVDVLLENFVPPATARRMQQVALLGCQVSGDMAPWRVPVVAFLLGRHIVDPDDIKPALGPSLLKALEALQEGPDASQVTAWLDTFK